MVRRLLDERHFTIHVRSTAQPNTAKLSPAAAVHPPTARRINRAIASRPIGVHSARGVHRPRSCRPKPGYAARRGGRCWYAQLECNKLDTELYDVQIVVDKRSSLESLFAKVIASATPVGTAPLRRSGGAALALRCATARTVIARWTPWRSGALCRTARAR